jgi:hypothetical protein
MGSQNVRFFPEECYGRADKPGRNKPVGLDKIDLVPTEYSPGITKLTDKEQRKLDQCKE